MQRIFFKSAILWLSILLLSVVGTLLIFETIFRYQIIDTFSGELRSFNPPEVLIRDSNIDNLLIMGDSFTASNSSYAAMLRTCQDEFHVINAGISGTGIIEAFITAPRRFDLAKPQVFVYQVFVGNDLFNIRYPNNWQELSVVRNVYWTIAQRLRSVWYLNYRNGQIAYLLGQSDSDNLNLTANWRGTDFTRMGLFGQTRAPEKFSPKKYTLRDKLMLEADPWILDKQIRITGDRQGDYQFFLDKLSDLLSFCVADECEGYVLVVPHQSQVYKRYFDNMKELGARFSSAEEILSEDYPFLTRIREFLAHNHLKHIHLLNPLPALRQSEQQGDAVYYQNDSHLNYQGNRILTEFLLEKLDLEPVCDFLG